MISLAGILFSLTVLTVILTMLIKRQLREKYAVLWIVIGIVVLVLSLFPALLVEMTHLVGVQVPANLIFALALVLLIGVCLHLSWELSRAEEEIRRVAEEIAVLRARATPVAAEDGSHSSSAED